LSREEIQEVANTNGFAVRANDTEFCATARVVATGGLSIPKMGATPFGHELALHFGMKLQKTRPALVPFTLSAADRKRYCVLSGLSAEVIVSTGKQSFREKMLITHRGLSGPSILQISSYWDSSQPISIDLAPGHDVTAPLRSPDTPRDLAAFTRALRNVLPQRFTDRWLEHHAPTKWTNQGLDDWEHQIHSWKLTPTGTEGYEKAEITAGGVSTDKLFS
jgi:predicted Rossmann fold flavoprotein